MDWRNWKNHPFIVTLVGALLLGYLVRKCTEPTPYTYSYQASPATKSTPAPAPVPVVTPAPVAFSAPVERPVISTPRYSSGRGGYTTYTFKLGEVSYQLDGKAAFDQLGQMKQQCEFIDAQKDVLRSEIDAGKRDLAEKNRQLSLARATLDRSSQYAIDAFNAQVESEGEMVDSLNRKVGEFNALNERRKAIFASMHDYAQQHRR